MRELISTGMNRRMKLLELLEDEHGWVSSSALSKALSCSLKTVIGDVQYLVDRWPEFLSIETSRQKGIRLLSPASHSLQGIYLEVLKESDAFSLIEGLFFDVEKDLEGWQQHFFLSSATMYRMLKQIETSLNRRDIHVNRSPLYLVSKDEREVRFFYTAYFMEVYGVHKWPFQLNQRKLLELSQCLNESLELAMDDSQIIHFSYLLAISFRRMQQGFGFGKQESKQSEMTTKVLEVLSDLEGEFKALVAEADWQLVDDWAVDLSQTAFFYLFGWESESEYQQLTKELRNFLYTVRSALSIELGPDCEKSIVNYLVYLYTKRKIYPYPEYILYNRFRYASEPIKRTYVAFTSVTKKALGMMERRTETAWMENFDEILHWMMVRWNHLPTLLDGLRKRVSVMVVSDLGEKHASLLVELLEGNFREKVAVDSSHVSFFQMTEENLKALLRYDLCVSNFMIPELPKDHLVVVDDIPSFRNWNDMRRMIEIHRLLLPESIPFIQTGKLD